jgi:hypothetical protein
MPNTTTFLLWRACMRVVKVVVRVRVRVLCVLACMWHHRLPKSFPVHFRLTPPPPPLPLPPSLLPPLSAAFVLNQPHAHLDG